MGYAGNEGDQAQIAAIDTVNDLVEYARGELYDGPSLKYCEDCGDEIPEKRRKAIKCKRCVSCQEAYDKLPKTRTRMLDHVL